MHGAGPGSLRIPSFVDDVISAMKQMGKSLFTSAYVAKQSLSASDSVHRYVDRGNLPKERKHSTTEGSL